MRYIVTGSTGCLGLNLTKRLISEGHEVMGLGRNKKLGKLITQMGAQFIPLNLQEQARLKKIASGADVIFHCAALSRPWGKYNDFYQSNVVGTKHVIEATPENTRLIHVSSPSIYFNFKEQFNIKENVKLPLKPANNYIKSKIQAELLIDAAFAQSNLDVVTIRPRAIFGPYDRTIIPRLLNAERQGILPVIGSGNNMIDITYVDNVVESLLLAANPNLQLRGQKFNITNDEPKSLHDILLLLYKALNKPLKLKHIPYYFAKPLASILEIIHQLFNLSEPRFTVYSCSVLALGQTLNIEAAKKHLNYKPIVNIEEGMKRFAKWYNQHD